MRPSSRRAADTPVHDVATVACRAGGRRAVADRGADRRGEHAAESTCPGCATQSITAGAATRARCGIRRAVCWGRTSRASSATAHARQLSTARRSRSWSRGRRCDRVRPGRRLLLCRRKTGQAPASAGRSRPARRGSRKQLDHPGAGQGHHRRSGFRGTVHGCAALQRRGRVLGRPARWVRGASRVPRRRGGRRRAEVAGGGSSRARCGPRAMLCWGDDGGASSATGWCRSLVAGSRGLVRGSSTTRARRSDRAVARLRSRSRA